MNALAVGRKAASLLLLEPGQLQSVATHRSLDHDFPTDDDLIQLLSAQPMGPTAWVVDDAWAPSLLLRDLADLPEGSEAREAFFRWRFTQQLSLEGPQVVQALEVENGQWLLAGLPEARRDAWMQLAQNLGRPMVSLLPRWLWLFNSLAPTLDGPGLLLSLTASGEQRYTGTLVAWGTNLHLVRQWTEPMALETWRRDCIAPTLAFLHRESRTPQELLVWGCNSLVEPSIPVRILPRELPSAEVR
jgi:hypothetical protein